MRLRVQESPHEDRAGIPPELKDWDHPTWSNAELCGCWVAAHLVGESDRQIAFISQSGDPAARWLLATCAWAIQNGFGRRLSPNAPDWERLEQVGIRQMKSLERARRRSATNLI